MLTVSPVKTNISASQLSFKGGPHQYGNMAVLNTHLNEYYESNEKALKPAFPLGGNVNDVFDNMIAGIVDAFTNGDKNQLLKDSQKVQMAFTKNWVA